MNNEYTHPQEMTATTEEYEEMMVTKEKCPNCERQLEQICSQDGADDYCVLGVYCDSCHWQMEF